MPSDLPTLSLFALGSETKPKCYKTVWPSDNMDPKDTDSICQAPVSQRALVGQHEKVFPRSSGNPGRTRQTNGTHLFPYHDNNISPPGHPAQPVSTHSSWNNSWPLQNVYILLLLDMQEITTSSDFCHVTYVVLLTTLVLFG